MFFFSQDLKWWQNLVVLQLIVYLIWLRLRWSWIKTVDQPDDDISRELSLMRLIRMIFQSVGKNPFLLHWTSCAPFRSFYFHLLEVIFFIICLKWHFKQTGEGLVNDIISCQWHQRLSGPKAKGLLLNNDQSNTSQSVTTVVWFETEKEGGATGSFRNRSKDILQCWAFIIITILSLFVIWGQNTLSPHSRELSLEKWVTVLVPSHVTSCVQCYCNTRASFP